MILTLLSSLVLPPPVSLQPAPGTSAEFQTLVAQVKTATARGDFVKAGRLATLLPKLNPVIVWDDSKLDPAQRADFVAARDFSAARWSTLVNGVAPKFVPKSAKSAKGDIVVSFGKTLARGAGAAHFFSFSTAEPRLETVFALRRDDQPTGGVDVQNETGYALGAYFGLTPAPQFGSAMGRTDVRAAVMTSPSSGEAYIAREALELSARLRKAIKDRERLDDGLPDSWVENNSIQLSEAAQGETSTTSFAIANRGTAPLRLRIMGDCGCLSAVGPTELAPGQAGVVRARYDTSAIAGDIGHKVLVYSNDPEAPLRSIPIRIRVKPAYQIIRSGGLSATLKGDEPVDMFLAIAGDKPFTVIAADLSGIPGEIAFEPWSGTLAHPELNEGPLARRGYRLRYTPKDLPAGKGLGAVTLTTDSKVNPSIVFNFSVQRGIVASPGSVYLGELTGAAGAARLALSRPGQAFRVIGITSGHKGVTAVLDHKLSKPDLAVIRIEADAKKIVGPLNTSITVKTDDPTQPEIVVSVVANVG